MLSPGGIRWVGCFRLCSFPLSLLLQLNCCQDIIGNHRASVLRFNALPDTFLLAQQSKTVGDQSGNFCVFEPAAPQLLVNGCQQQSAPLLVVRLLKLKTPSEPT